MIRSVLLIAMTGTSCLSCAPPGYRYETGSFTAHPIDQDYPPNITRVAEAQSPVHCDTTARSTLIERLTELRHEESQATDAALRDEPGSREKASHLAQMDRDIQDRIIALCPGEEIPQVK